MEGLLRVGGRLSKSLLPTQAKHQIILSKEHPNHPTHARKASSRRKKCYIVDPERRILDPSRKVESKTSADELFLLQKRKYEDETPFNG